MSSVTNDIDNVTNSISYNRYSLVQIATLMNRKPPSVRESLNKEGVTHTRDGGGKTYYDIASFEEKFPQYAGRNPDPIKCREVEAAHQEYQRKNNQAKKNKKSIKVDDNDNVETVSTIYVTIANKMVKCAENNKMDTCKLLMKKLEALVATHNKERELIEEINSIVD